MMKRVITIALATLALSVGAFPWSAQAVDVKDRPKCSDINGNDGASYYQVDATPSTLHEAILFVQIETVLPLCKNVQLTVYVSADNSTFVGYTYPGDTHFASCSPSAPGGGCVTFTYSYGYTGGATSAAPPFVYVYLQTSTGQGSVSDRAPNIGTAPFTLCDHDPSTSDHDSNGKLLDPCGIGGGNYFQ